MSRRSASSGGLPRALCVALAVLAICGAFASAAQALPRGFWGAVPQNQLNAEQMQRLAGGGVESLRIPFSWAAVQGSEGGPYDWSAYDSQVEDAAAAGIGILPFLSGAPEWAVPAVYVSGTHHTLKAPAHLPVTGAAGSGWIGFVRAAVERYGPGGSFWAAHPALPQRPIRVWQIWNEANFKYFIAKPSPKEYGQLVKISSSAIHGIDSGAQVVLAGLFARPKFARNPRTGKHKSLNWYASDFIDAMYRSTPGIGRRFDGVALHPYSVNARELPGVIAELRRVLAIHGDGGKGLWITELGWSSGRPSPGDLFAKRPAGQARELRTAFSLLSRNQARWRLRSVYWFSVDDAPGACNFCDGSGLFREGFIPKRAWYAYVHFAGGHP